MLSGIAYRRIPANPNFYSVRKGQPGRFNFQLNRARGERELSMHWAEKVVSIEAICANHQGCGIAELSIEWLWEHGYRVTHTPDFDEPDHLSVWGLEGATDDALLEIAKACRMKVLPQMPDP